MISLKRPKKKKEQPDSIEPVGNQEGYFWGSQLSFDEAIIDKIKVLEEIRSGTKVKIEALAFISEVRTSEYAKGPGKTATKNQSVTIQLTKIDIVEINEAEKSFDEEK